MNAYKSFFHNVSYLQYPLYLVALIFLFIPFNTQLEEFPRYLNKCLFFLGLAIGISTLQDTTKTQNNLSKRIWENPRKGKSALIMMASISFIFLMSGLIGLLLVEDGILEDISLGNLAIGIAYIGVLRSALEMFEYHSAEKANEDEIIEEPIKKK
jgi:hypothetical protein